MIPPLVVGVSLETLERMRTATDVELKVFAACLPPAAGKIVLDWAATRPTIPPPFSGNAERIVTALTSRKTLARVERELAKLSPPKKKPRSKKRKQANAKNRKPQRLRPSGRRARPRKNHQGGKWPRR